MKIALFHNSYRIRGGEDRMFELETDALRKHGHEVITYHIENSEALGQDTLYQKIRTALEAPYSRRSKKSVQRFLKKHQPDISHIHNWFPLITPSIYTAHQKANVPVIQTLHNYRLGCASANYRRDGKDCNSCNRQSNTSSIRHRCYKNSLFGSISWKLIIDRNWRNQTFTQKVDRYLCPSHEVYNRHRLMGIPVEKLQILPNACPDPRSNETIKSKKKQFFEVVFAGRLVAEKGTQILVEAWQKIPSKLQQKSRLTIIGDGPELVKLKRLTQSTANIRFAGELDHSSTLKYFNKSDLLVCPTLWAEPFGLTIIEAMGAGIPIIASEIGAPQELIRSEKTGLLVKAGDAAVLAKALIHLIKNPDIAKDMGDRGRANYEALYTKEAHAKALTATFKETIAKHRYASSITTIQK